MGGRLVMYMPVPLSLDHVESSLPAVRRTPDGPWEPLVDAATLYAPLSPLRGDPVVHTVMSCDVGRGRFGCRAVGALGPAGRNFYVSHSAVYLWLEGEAAPSGVAASLGPPPSTVLRLPLDCGAPGAVIAQGAPSTRTPSTSRAASPRGRARRGGAARVCGRPRSAQAASRSCGCPSRSSPTPLRGGHRGVSVAPGRVRALADDAEPLRG